MGSSQPDGVKDQQQGRREANQPSCQPQPAGSHLQVRTEELPWLRGSVSCSLVDDACMTSTSGEARSRCSPSKARAAVSHRHYVSADGSQ